MAKGKSHETVTGEIIRLHELPKYVGLSRATIYRMVKKGDFVPIIHLTSQSRGVRKSDVERWIEERVKIFNPEHGTN